MTDTLTTVTPASVRRDISDDEIARAIADPGSVVGARRTGEGPVRWAARAVRALLAGQVARPLNEASRICRCMLPTCGASFDLVAVLSGEATAGCWVQVAVFGGDHYLCPDHGHGMHLPMRLADPARPGCSCGWESAAGGTGRDMANAWISHASSAYML